MTMNWAAARSGPLRRERFDESLIRCQDVDLSYRLFQAGCSFAFVPDAIVYHRNERTLGGLFREGFTHGYWAVRTRKKHRTLLRSHGYGLVAWRAHMGLVPASAAALRGRDGSGPELAFLWGRATGGLVGSFRFGHPSL